MEIIKHSRKRAVKFTCTHCWCVFKEEHNKCMTGEHTSYSYASGEDAILHRVGLSWRGSRTTTQYYACMCPECGKMVETTVNDYHKQCHEEYEAEQKAEQQKKEEDARNAYWERQVEHALNETETRRWHKERDDDRILGERQQQTAEVLITKALLPHYVLHPLHVECLPISPFLVVMGLADGLLGSITVITHDKLTLNSNVCVRTVRERSCYVGALAVMEVDALQVEVITTHHVAERQRQSLPHVIAMTKGITIQRRSIVSLYVTKSRNVILNVHILF